MKSTFLLATRFPPTAVELNGESANTKPSSGLCSVVLEIEPNSNVSRERKTGNAH